MLKNTSVFLMLPFESNSNLFVFDSNIDPRLSLLVIVLVSIKIIISYSTLHVFAYFVLSILLFVFLRDRKFKHLIIISFFPFIFFLMLIILKIFTPSVALFYFLRLLSISLLFTWFYLSMEPYTLVQTLVWYKLPYKWAWTVGASFRYIDIFINETKQIYQTLLLRSVPFDGNLIQKFRNLPYILIPLIYRVNIRQRELMRALFIRGWHSWGKKNFYYKINFFSLNNFLWGFFIGIILIFS